MIEVNGARLAYDEAGVGPTVVFSHAGIADRRMWEPQLRDLAADHRVIRYDWRGYGESSDAAGEFSHHRDLLALLDALDVEPATLVGCSMGGAYSLDAALAAPERVTALVMICSGLSGHQWPVEMAAYVRDHVRGAVPAERLAAYGQHAGVAVRDDDVRAMALAQARFLVAGPDRDPAAVDPGVWREALIMLEGVFRRLWSGPPSTEVPADPPAVGRLSEVRVPTMVINGLDDAPWIQQVSAMLATGIPHAQRIDLSDAGHLPSIEYPKEISALLRTFLRDQRN
jgi:pimeloyl-ACP methyl ester carboxylesterase